MVQFNLLPDVKIAYIRSKQTKRKVTLIAVTIGGFALTLMILLFVAVNFLQRQHLNNLGNDIASYSKTLEDTPELTKILTVQNQLNNLTGLHDQKPVASRLDTYLKQLTPANASIAQLDLSFVDGTIILTGKADALSTVNQFVDTLKFTTYKIDDQTGNAFSEVVLSSFGRLPNEASYVIDLKFDPIIFDATLDAVLVVPNIVTTRSAIERPDALFQQLPESSEEGEQ